MKSKKFIVLAGMILFSIGISTDNFLINSQPNVVRATSTSKITLKHNAYQYSSKGKRLNKKTLKKGETYTAIGTKKIASKQYYRIFKNSYIKASNVASKKSKTSVVKNTLKLTYSLAEVRAAKYSPTLLDKKSLLGMRKNQFHSESKSEDKEQLDLNNLTTKQANKLADYSLRLINQVRSQLGLSNWLRDSKTQKLAADVAKEYRDNGKSILDSDHYIDGIVRAAKRQGLKIDHNFIENEGGYYGSRYTTMTDAKKNIYWNLKQFLFGGATSEEGPFVEYEHANNILKAGTSTYGFNISVKDNVVSTHFIDVSQDTVKYSTKHGGTWK